MNKQLESLEQKKITPKQETQERLFQEAKSHKYFDR